jgi:hypothetical protein
MAPSSPGNATSGALNRSLGIALRTAHILSMAIYVGGVWFGASGPPLEWWRALALGSGLGLLWSELSHGPGWLFQARGLATVSHVLALALVGWGEPRAGTALAVVIGSVGSHAPRWIRKWSLKDGRSVE